MIHSIGMSSLIRYIMLIPCCLGLVMVAGEEGGDLQVHYWDEGMIPLV